MMIKSIIINYYCNINNNSNIVINSNNDNNDKYKIIIKIIIN